jgi:hypothetical protein
MERTFETFLELKSTLLNEIASKGNEGMPESSLFERLYVYGKKCNAYSYREGLTPERLLSSLITDGYIFQVCTKDYYECRYIANRKRQSI